MFGHQTMLMLFKHHLYFPFGQALIKTPYVLELPCTMMPGLGFTESDSK